MNNDKTKNNKGAAKKSVKPAARVARPKTSNTPAPPALVRLLGGF